MGKGLSAPFPFSQASKLRPGLSSPVLGLEFRLDDVLC